MSTFLAILNLLLVPVAIIGVAVFGLAPAILVFMPLNLVAGILLLTGPRD